MKKFIEKVGNIDLYQNESGLRHYLDGQEIRCGTSLELLMEDGRWMPVRYECELFLGLKTDFEGNVYGPSPDLYFEVHVAGLPQSTGEQAWYYPDAHIHMPSYGRARWPEKKRRP
jgi:hypothetical protein